MSEWFEITDPKDIEVSDNGETIEVWFDSDKNGNKYVDIPISLIAEVIGAELKKGRDKCKNIAIAKKRVVHRAMGQTQSRA